MSPNFESDFPGLVISLDDVQFSPGSRWLGHNFFRVEVYDKNSELSGVFFVDNGAYGGGDHIFFIEDLVKKLPAGTKALYYVPEHIRPLVPPEILKALRLEILEIDAISGAE